MAWFDSYSKRNRGFFFDNVFKSFQLGGTTVASETTNDDDTKEVLTTNNLHDSVMANITAVGNLTTISVGEVFISSQTIKNAIDGHNLILEATGSGVVQVNDTLTANELTVSGNLTVNGATTTVSSTNTNISDSLILLADGTSGAPTKDSGLIIERGSSQNVGLIWDESSDTFSVVTTPDDATTVGDITIVDYADMRVGAVTIDDTITLGGTTITATATEINYLDGVTSAIQTQIDNISSSFTLAADSGSNDTFTTGQTLTIAGGTGIDTTVSDNQISIAVDSTIATESYVNTANVNLKGYTDNEITTANVAMKGYVDGAVSTLTANAAVQAGLIANNTSAITTANLAMKGYVDNSVTTANVALKGYTDNEITTANVALKSYSDATFAPLAGSTFTGTVNLSARNRLRFSDTDNSNYVEFRSASTVASNVLWTLPAADGTSGQALVTDGAGNLSWATATGGGGGASGFQASTISTHPAAGGDEDLRTGPNDDTAETPFEAGGSDAFGVSLGSVYDQMEPVGSLIQVDLGDEEAYIGA